MVDPLIGATELYHKIRAAKEELKESKALPCQCSGFVRQYEGHCCCLAGVAISAAETKLHNLIEEI